MSGHEAAPPTGSSAPLRSTGAGGDGVDARHSGDGDGRPASTTGMVGLFVGLALGGVLMAVGVRFALQRPIGLPKPLDLGRWLVTILVVHDGLWVSVAVVIGWLTARVLAEPFRIPVRVGLGLTAVLTLATLPVTRRYGAIPSNPTVDPGNAGMALLVLLAILWSAVVIWCGVRRRHAGTLRRAT